MRVKSFTQEHNAVTLTRAQINLLNHESSMLTIRLKIMILASITKCRFTVTVGVGER